MILFLRACRLVARLAWLAAAGLARAIAWLTRRGVRWTRGHPNRPAYVAVAGVAVTLLTGYVIFLSQVESGLKRDVDCLALDIYHEARGEPKEAQVAVAQVVMNRIAHPRFPNNACAVIKQGGEWPHFKCQFEWWCDGRSDQAADEVSMARIRPLARDVLLGKFADPTNGSLWYHAKRVSPEWRKDFVLGPTIGDHIFYIPPERAHRK